MRKYLVLGLLAALVLAAPVGLTSNTSTVATTCVAVAPNAPVTTSVTGVLHVASLSLVSEAQAIDWPVECVTAAQRGSKSRSDWRACAWAIMNNLT